MKYKKAYPKTSRKTVDVLAVDGAISVGCYVSGGKLVPAINSATQLRILSLKATFSWYAEGPKKYIMITQNRVYYTSGALSSAVMLLFTAKSPSMVEMVSDGEPAAYVIGDTSYLYIGKNHYTQPFNGAVYSCVVKNGRIFGIDNSDPYKIKWSGEGGIDDWEEGISGAGWTTVQYGYGEILNLIVYKDKIVVVRKHGLTFLSAYGAPENFKLSYLETKLPEIYQNTAAVVGDKLAFYTEDGLYFYDGNKVEKCAAGLAEEMVSPTTASAANGKYYLCGKSKTNRDKEILVYDARLNAAYLIPVAANTVSVGEKIYAYGDSYEYRLEEGGVFAFTSGELTFSSTKEKLLKEVIFDCEEDVALEVSNGVSCNILGGVRGKYRPNMRGKSFTIKVSGTEKINGVYAVAEVADGV